MWVTVLVAVVASGLIVLASSDSAFDTSATNSVPATSNQTK
jgi:hypothetical protein